MKAAAPLVLLAALAVPSAFAAGNAPYPEGVREWIHVKSMVIHDRSHPLYGYHDVYVNPLGYGALRAGTPYPAGSTLAVVFYEAVAGEGSYSQGRPLKVVVMRKDPARTDTGGWAFEAFRAGSREPLVGDAAREQCFGCHTQVRERDYVFSTFRDSGG
ncbi:cytochrome P460 family protein [Inmirania thermothiophila]|uniref:Cytochrome P460 n=1 Tax=Inmirania thermothiophila TaxID=1750597 RepID=A0A3N1Y8Y5_9GAMM|nr:cytochrome P460 family protein [Inmirania thermothiophila]ROR34958.1 cytochrome P460 [Inmirania thermothiophila]